MQVVLAGRFMAFGAIGLLLCKGACAQSPQRFEVASIRPTRAAPGDGTSVKVSPGGRLTIVNEPIKLLVRQAFRVQDSQIAGGPPWLDTDRYDIEAKASSPERISPDQMGPLIQNLLIERFSLKFHRETREMRVLALVPSKDGSKLKPKADGEASGTNTSGDRRESHMTATAVSMELLAVYVGNRLNRIVVDKTGLGDSYDFTLDWAPEEAPDSQLPDLTTALREQLGLSLRPQTSPVVVLVIDNLSRPSEN